MNQPSSLIRRSLSTDVTPVRQDLIMPFHVLGKGLGIRKYVQTDVTSLLGVPSSD